MKQITINNDCLCLTVLDYGAIIQKLVVKNKEGKEIDVVVGLDKPADYLSDPCFLGACVGRYAGRISKKGFELLGKTYPLSAEHGVHLHGGKQGFGKKTWTIEAVENEGHPAITLTYLSRHMEEGYPGNLRARVTYTLIANSLHIHHEATTDQATVLNLVNHSYFKLDDSASIGHYDLQLNCPEYLETHENLLPTGKIVSVKDSPYDFRRPKKIGALQLDTPYVTDINAPWVLQAFSEKSGVLIRVKTNQPAVVVYTPPHLPAICFETQNFPDAPNNPHFPSALLEPGSVYSNRSSFQFMTDVKSIAGYPSLADHR